MKTRVCMILETLLVSFGMAKETLKEHRGVHTRVKGSLDSSTKKKKKKKNNTKYEKFRRRKKEQAQG